MLSAFTCTFLAILTLLNRLPGPVCLVDHQPVDAVAVGPVVAHLEPAVLVVLVARHVDAGPVDDKGLVDGPVIQPGAAELVLLDADRIVVALVVVRNVVLISMHLIKEFR